MSKKPVMGTSPYTLWYSSPTLMVEKYGTKGGDRDKPKAYAGHVVKEKWVAGTETQAGCYNDWDFWISVKAPWARIESKLQAKLQDLLGERAEIGTTLAEYHSAVQMVESGARRLGSAALNLRRGNFRGFLEDLNSKPLAKHRHWVRSSPKIASQLWIEYWFGWAPTINDIQTAGRILDSDPPVGYIPYSVASGADWTLSQEATAYSPFINVSCKSYAKTGGSYTMTNPNLALAQKLGLLNPLVIVVNVTAWSWLLGWFVNLNQWVDSLTAFSGYDFKDCYTTRYTTFSGIKRIEYHYPYRFGEYTAEGYLMTRQLRLPIVKLHTKNFKLSLTRAATAVSLLTMRLKSL